MLRQLVLLPLLLLLAGCPFDNNEFPPAETGLQTFESNGVEREYYLLLPEDNAPANTVSPSVVSSGDPDKPLLIALHGTGGTYRRWTENQLGYDLIEPVGDEAVMVFPNALPDANGSPQWSFAYDFEFFLDLLAHLDRRGVQYDPDRIFVTGHSSGAGMAHEIGCRFGDIVRAIAPSAGTLISTECIGAVAVLMAQGENDALVNIDIASGARRFWSLYNGYDNTVSVAADIDPCVDHSLLGAANTPYPVYWCQHSEGSIDDFSGHRWASFTGEAVWRFFSSLPPKTSGVNLTDPPPGGGNERARIPSDTTITFTVRYPDQSARPLDGAITLYDEDYLENPTFSIPSVFLNTLWPVGQVAAGDTVTYTVPITFFVFSGPPVEFPSTWTLSINVYVEGGTRPTPTAGLDLQYQQLITFDSMTNPITLPGVIELQLARCFLNCDE
ncbi:MAG: hypothetical protein HKN56_03585 [Gammaproteobacteria bacterium]|nr:hypothetical protein [Gammaproteobacteria bacterium]NND54039.1 hypothetical protein [Gammaproteobacteria bacterium]